MLLNLLKESSELQIGCSTIEVKESYIHFNHSNSMQSRTHLGLQDGFK